jgi:hypothetical protein
MPQGELDGAHPGPLRVPGALRPEPRISTTTLLRVRALIRRVGGAARVAATAERGVGAVPVLDVLACALDRMGEPVAAVEFGEHVRDLAAPDHAVAPSASSAVPSDSLPLHDQPSRG